jgi:hypothetical protein
MDSKRVWEVALTVLVAVFLLVAAEGRYPYGFYMVLRTAATVGGIYWAVRLLLSCLTRSCQSGCTGSTGSQLTWLSACCCLDGLGIGSGAPGDEHEVKAAQVASLGTGRGSR